jgi:hypothetical protein
MVTFDKNQIMTKEEFISGTRFHYVAGMTTRPYKFVPATGDALKHDNHEGRLEYFGLFEANVARITKSYIDCHVMILGNLVKVRIHLKNLHV